MYGSMSSQHLCNNDEPGDISIMEENESYTKRKHQNNIHSPTELYENERQEKKRRLNEIANYLVDNSHPEAVELILPHLEKLDNKIIEKMCKVFKLDQNTQPQALSTRANVSDL